MSWNPIFVGKEGDTHLEISPIYGAAITLDIGSDVPVILDKMYGPLIFTNLRITPSFKTCEWVIERQRIDSMEWIEVARIAGQYDYEYDETDPRHRTVEQANGQ